MVLYRRKPVVFEPVPKNVRDDTEVWTIVQTGEVFNDYEKFLNRRDFYEQRKFTCESTGHTGFTYFQALESETEASKEINSILPDALKSRILHHVQFDNTHRMDDLVNQVFDYFKEFFLVNDRVSIEGEPMRRFGRIIEMTDHGRLNNMFSSASIDESLRPYIYVIQMDDNDERVTKYKASELQRDRRFYSKIILKQFLRSAISRDSSVGSLWMVKENLAKRYGIPTKVPDPKTRESLLAQRRAANGIVLNGFGPPEQHPYPQQLPNGHAPQVNGHRPQIAGPGQSQATFVNFSPNGPQQYIQEPGRPPLIHHHLPHIHGHGPPPGFALYHQPPIFNGGPAPGHPLLAGPFLQPNLLPHIAQLVQQNPMAVQQLVMQQPHYQTSFPHNQPQAQPSQPQVQNVPQRTTKIYEPIKYPMEDLEIKQPRTEPVRPPLKFFSDDVPEGVEERSEEQKTGILMKSVGPLLCAWETLNVHDTIYSLDSFTFDDFVDAMRFSHEEIECELFVEVHCSILKQIVNDSGKILAPIPKMAETEESEDEDSSEEATPTPEPEPPVRTTRSSLRKSEAQQLVKQRTPTPEPPKEIHRAEAFSQEFNWVEQCQIRNFRQGGWQAIVVGLLYQLSFDPLQKDACDEILAQLVPPTEDPSVESIAANYVDLDPNLRVSALNLILRLTVVTEAFREQLVLAGQEMTRLRKEKIDHQRRRKELADEYSKLELERKILLPANTPASPTLQAKEDVDMDATITSITSDTKEGDDPEDEDAEETKASKARLRHTQKNKRKAAAEEARKEKAKKAKAEAEKTKKQKEWEKLLDAIDKKDKEIKECEANINELDDDLRETLVHRSKVLGKDRFLNKYYWFEHNGMPFGGVPTSSTAEYGYANGRLWVQGPDEYEFQPNMEEPAISQDKERFGFTIPQRKAKEEGETHLTKSSEWAYYDDPQDIDKLLLWLDERGVREKALRKELQIFRDRIAEYMEIMKKHLSDKEKPEEEEEEETTTRVSTRNKTYIDKDSVKDRCLLWTNSIMREELGYNHSEEYEPPRKAKAKAVKATKGKGRR